METITLNKVYSLLDRMNQKLDAIEVELRELKEEKELEVRPEYIEKLKKISKEKGEVFNSIEEFDEAFA